MKNKKIEFDSMVICSTLNQMVNYIVIKEHNIKKIYNITAKKKTKKSGKFDHQEWNKNLKKVLGDAYSIHPIEYDENEISNHKNIMDILKKQKYKSDNKNEKILWNITGGQRHIVMAITNYVYNERPGDVIVYFEGDNEKMYYYSNEDKNITKKNININNTYDMSIEIALGLMGFNSKSKLERNDNNMCYKSTSKYYKFIMSSNEEEFKKLCSEDKTSYNYGEIDTIYQWYNNFYYIYRNSAKLRELLICSNKLENGKDDEKNNILNQLINKIQSEENLKKIKEEVYEDSVNIDEVLSDNIKTILEKSLKNYSRGKVFGYILERMTLYKIIHDFKNGHLSKEKLSDIDISVKLKGSTIDENMDKEKFIDEFDILIVTKKGKVIMLECKSGGMTGDNAKSHNYSTYAVAGVYGTPILVSPITKEEFIKNKDKDNENNIYKNIKSAINSAEKARLKIWGITDEGGLIKLIKERY